MTNELLDLAAAAIGPISAFLEVGTAVLMVHGLAARRSSEDRRSTAHVEDRVAQGDAGRLRRFARWNPCRRSRRRYGRRSGSA